MRSLHTVVAVALSLLVGAAPALGQAKLEAGDPAPLLTVDRWVQGDPVAIAPGTFYIVMFFSTIEGDALPTFAGLSTLQKQVTADNLRILAIADEEYDPVNSYVARMKTRLTISIATDKFSRSSNGWVRASKHKDLPVAFIVGDDGRIMYIGEVTDDKFLGVLNRVMRHRFDAKHEREQLPRIEAARRARKIKNWSQAMKLYDEVIASNRTVFADIALEKFDLMVVEIDDAKQAYKYVASLMEDYAADPQFLSDLARKIAADPNIPEASRRMDVALKAAEEARAVTRESSQPEALSTLALVHFHNKDIAKAVELQKDAWFRAPTSRKAEYKRVLDSYQAALQRSEAKSAAQSQQK